MSTVTIVTDTASLNAAIETIDLATQHGTLGAYTIDLANNITLTTQLDAINIAAGASLTIAGAGGGGTLDGANTYNGLFVYSGTVTVENLSIDDAVAEGGAGGSGLSGGGGGAGLGGGLFVAGPTQGSGGGNVTLINVAFNHDSAVGGAGGAQTVPGYQSSYGLGGGGGLLGGNGGSGSLLTSAGGGGGIGTDANGGSGAGAPGDAGLVVGGSAGGSGASGGAGGASGGGGGDGYGNAGNNLYGGGGGGVGGASGSASNTTSGFGGNGGFGGGGGGGTGAGGFGGGGGGDGGGGGFGGGGGGGGSSGGGGGFGAGAGGSGGFSLVAGGGGGGGLGAGGDIFVQQGGSLTIEGGTVNNGTVVGGTGGSGQNNNSGSAGSAYGAGIFIEGNQSVTLAAPLGQITTLAGNITDESDNGGSGSGSLVIDGGGTVALTAVNTYAGSTTLNQATTLQIFGTATAGSGTIAVTDASVLQIGGPIANKLGTLAGVLDDTASLYTQGETARVSNGNLVLSNGTSFAVTTGFAGNFLVLPDAAGDTEILSETIAVKDTQGLDAALADDAYAAQFLANKGSLAAFTITLANSFTLSAPISVIDLPGGSTLAINGGGNTLSGGGSYDGFDITGGSVALSNLTISNTASGIGSDLEIGAGATTSVAGVVLSGANVLGGAGTLVIAGLETLSASSALAGPVEVLSSAGTLVVSNSAGIGSGNMLVLGGGGTLDLGAGVTLNNPAMLSGAATIAVPIGTASLTGPIAGAGSLTLSRGVLSLSGANSYSGGTTIPAGSTLALSNASAGGTGGIAVSGDLQVTGPINQTITQLTGTLDDTALTYVAGETVSLSNGVLTIDATGVSFNVGAGITGSFAAVKDAGNGTELLPSTYIANTSSLLNADIAAIDTETQALAARGVAAAFTLDLTSNITLSQQLDAIDLGAGSSLTIVGNGETLSGANTYRGLFIYDGNVTVESLTIANAKAVGGAGGTAAVGAGGGGAGLGGAIFVAGTTQGSGGANVTLINVGFSGDSATGGAGGNGGGTGEYAAGGGGLGGAGGVSGSASGSGRGIGGGGGIGGAGGSGATHGGGTAGIIIGAASAGAGVSGAAGTDGGGGGASSAAGAGGGGVGGKSGSATAAGTGGFGGGGGGSPDTAGKAGGKGGFGGGGGGSYEGAGGAGGFGGGGGGGDTAGGTAGFGGGKGYGTANKGAGGGGLGAGGDVFVQQGATLTIEAGTVANGSVKGGAAGTSGTASGGAGAAYGAGLFIQGNEAVTLAPGIGQNLLVSGVIADQDGAYISQNGTIEASGTSADGTPFDAVGTLVIGAGTVSLTAANTFSGPVIVQSGGELVLTANNELGIYNAGTTTNTLDLTAGSTLDFATGFTLAHPAAFSGSATVAVAAGTLATFGALLSGTGGFVFEGGGTLALAGGANSYTGGTTIGAGTLVLAAIGAAGSGAITFGGSGSTLVIDKGDTPTNLLSGFTIGDVIDLAGVSGLTNSAQSGSTLTLSGGGTTVNLQITPPSADLLSLTSDGAGGTDVTLLADTAPTVTGLAPNQVGQDNAATDPFNFVTIASAAPSQTLTVSVVESSTLDGVFSHLGSGVFSGGTYSVTGTAQQVSSAIDALVFTPTQHQTAPGNGINTGFTLSATDGILSATATTTLAVQAIASALTFNAPTTSFGITDEQSVNPFSTVSLSDPNIAQTETVSVALSGASGSGASGALSDSLGGAVNSFGTYTAIGTAVNVAADLAQLVFTPTPHEVAPGVVATTTLTTTLTDTAGQSASIKSTVNATAVNDTPVISGTGPLATTDAASAAPFAHVTITDPDYGATETLSLYEYNAGYGLTAGFTDGTLSGAGLIQSPTSPGLYTLTGSPSLVTQEIDALRFTPTAHQTAPGQSVTTDFILVATQNGSSAYDGNTSIIATATNDAPTITGALTGQTISDEASIHPFSSLTISDVDAGSPTETVTVNPTVTTNGTLTDPNIKTDGGTLSASDVFTISGSQAQVNAALAGLVFTPKAHQVVPGLSVTTGFTITATQTENGTTSSTTTNTTTSVIATAVNDAPTISGSNSVTTNDETSVKPFTATTVSDPDIGVTETVELVLSNNGFASNTDADGTLSGTGLTKTGAGTYTLTGSTSVVTAELQALSFTPTAHQVAPGQSVTTGVIILDAQGNQQVGIVGPSITATAVNDAPKISGTVGGQVTTDYVPIKPFSAAVISDVDTGVTDNLTITLKNSSGTATDANGTLSGTGLAKTGTGTYMLSAAPSTLTTELQALTFTPTQAEVAAGKTVTTSFTLTATQNAGGVTTSATDSTTSVTTTALNYITGSSFGFSLLYGTSGADVITAQASFNTIYGNGGNDFINATTGGHNTFVLPNAGQGVETITGFSETNGDVLNLASTLLAAGYIPLLTNLSNYLKVTGSGSSTILSIAPGGSGSSVQLAVLNGSAGLGLTDLLSHNSVIT
jgi:hypothetical protein